ncbi:hypothetical protein [Jiangella asiatica]|uniref:HTH domain-containing protein n=1 Tax=Jiangella asiatica TaxID=2530372 RepID=A0A4R5D7E6_9ACTN|nr:hypothetical protein [Jiangella asiatica]TDE08567.1 hypothetical protein E1269_16695 [Jiangella asiatica]
MDTSIGVVGPHDLVDSVAAVCEEQAGVRVHRFDYDHETQAPGLVTTHASGVDAWLFTGIVPYTIAHDALTRPASFVDYSGSTLLQALVRLLRDGADVTALSVDTLDTAQVDDTLAEAGVPTDGVRTLPYRPGATAADMAAFHRRHAARHPGAVAVTCLASVHDELAGELPVFRLAPSPQSVRAALRQLLLTASSQIQEDAQVALGLVELGPAGAAGPDLAREVGMLGGSLSRYSDTMSLIVTTRGPLHDASHGFTALPLLHRLGQRHDIARIGFGLGHSGAEAERLARRALARARNHGDVAAVVSSRNDVDILLEVVAPAQGPVSEQSRAVVASRVGLSVATLDRLREITSANGDRPLTTRDIADGLGVQLRTARRMLQRLELAGCAERSGSLDSGTIGRPLTLYRVSL